MPYNPQVHHRHSIRLKDYDYSQAGAYFVTLCLQPRLPLLGEICDGEVILSPDGHLAAACWLWLAERYPYVCLDAWVIMPNHLHGIIVLLDGLHVDDAGLGREPPVHAERAPRKPLGRLVGVFKTMSTKYINLIRGTSGSSFWQRNYYETIIRNPNHMERVRHYIAANPGKWEEDKYYVR